MQDGIFKIIEIWSSVLLHARLNFIPDGFCSVSPSKKGSLLKNVSPPKNVSAPKKVSPPKKGSLPKNVSAPKNVSPPKILLDNVFP